MIAGEPLQSEEKNVLRLYMCVPVESKRRENVCSSPLVNHMPTSPVTVWNAWPAGTAGNMITHGYPALIVVVWSCVLVCAWGVYALDFEILFGSCTNSHERF